MSKQSKAAKNEVILNDDSNNPLGFLDQFDGPDDSDLWQETYAFVQWNNRAKAWEFPIKHWAGTAIEANNEITEVDHNNGVDTEHSVLIDIIHVSVIAWRYTWEKPNLDGKPTYALRPVEGEKGWRKRYNFLCLIKESESDEPCIITARSFTGEYMYNALMNFRKKILKTAQRASGNKLPGYIFWTPLTAGEKLMVGKEQKSAIYPPVAIVDDVSELDDEGIANLLQSLYIGDELAAVIRGGLFTEGQSWATEHRDKLQLPSGNNVGTVDIQAEVLPGGMLYLPDLSKEKRAKWIDCAMTIDGLFNSPTHASNALSKCLRDNRGKYSSNDTVQMWEVWRVELEKRVAEKHETDEAVERQAMLAAG